ncbi:hypothetical protein [Paenibacillus paeoniae]|uniref:Uncharacterized protein n=1 Tax=Paenibacillus paeoniae TaxID=2292705 RepID=A0A371PFG4_9BACL|nr:hypothetical protein [Paenibacillus paeoniae]REK74691.1 hypothetical protein DX130_13520 [Paenibacillus paeoniae]
MATFPIIIQMDDKLNSNQAIRHKAQEVIWDGKNTTRIHTAWKLQNGHVMVHEYNSANNPSSTICFFDSLHEYMDECNELSWL